VRGGKIKRERQRKIGRGEVEEKKTDRKLKIIKDRIRERERQETNGFCICSSNSYLRCPSSTPVLFSHVD